MYNGGVIIIKEEGRNERDIKQKFNLGLQN